MTIEEAKAFLESALPVLSARMQLAIKTLERESVLDDIRTEIETIIGKQNLDDYDFCSGLICARKIIDKYKAQPKNIEMQATEFLVEARACAEKDDDLER